MCINSLLGHSCTTYVWASDYIWVQWRHSHLPSTQISFGHNHSHHYQTNFIYNGEDDDIDFVRLYVLAPALNPWFSPIKLDKCTQSTQVKWGGRGCCRWWWGNKVGGMVSRLVRLQNPGDEMWGVPQGKSQAIWFPIRNILIPLPRYLILCLDQKGQRGNKPSQTNALYLLPIFVAFVKNLAHFGHQFRFMRTIYFVFNPN